MDYWSKRALQYQDDRAGTQTDDPMFLKYRDACEKEQFLKLIWGHPRRYALEMGCGTGRWSNWLASYYENVLGIDASMDMLRIAQKNAPGNVCYLPARAEEFEVGTYDLIYFSSVLQYLDDQEAVKALIHARQRSELIISRDTLVDGAPLQPDYPVIYRSRKEFNDLVDQAGLKTVSTCRAYDLPQRARAIMRFLPMADTKKWTDRTPFLEPLLVALKGEYHTNIWFTVLGT